MDTLTKTIDTVKAEAKENLVPIVRDKTLECLLKTCREIGATKVLEIGTATGYSALNILTVAQNVVTIEKNKERFEQAKQNFADAQVSLRVTQLLGDAGEVLQNLSAKGQIFDLIFLDGPKGQYLRYLPYISHMLESGGILFADNILLNGLFYDDSRVNHKNRAMVKNMRAFVEEIKNTSDFETTIYEIEDGFAICKKQ